MFNDNFKNIVNFGNVIINNDGLYTQEKEESLYTYINEKGFSKENKSKTAITKPLIKDDGFILYKKIKGYILETYKNNNNSYKGMFGGKSIKKELSIILGENIDITIFSESYIKEKYGEEYFKKVLSNIGFILPNEFILSNITQPSAYGDIKLTLKSKCQLHNIQESKIKILDTFIEAWFPYWYCIDTNTKEIKSFFRDNDFNQIIKDIAKDNIKDIKKDTLTKEEYIFIGDSKIPINKDIDIKTLKTLKNNYYVGNKVIENKFRISWYGINIDIIPNNLGLLLNEKQLIIVLKTLEEAISRYNKGDSNKDIQKAELLKFQFNLFHLLNEVYENFQNNKNTELSILNAIPFSFIFRQYDKISKKWVIIESINGVTLSQINTILETFKLKLSQYEKHKNITSKEVIEIINKLLYSNVIFSNWINNDGSKPKNDFLLKIQFIKQLLLNNEDKVLSLLSKIPIFIKKEKIKNYNGTSKSKENYGNWYIYNTIQELLGKKDKKIKDDRIDIDNELYHKNIKLINIMKDSLKINKKNIENLIIQLRTYNKENINTYLFKNLINYTLLNTDIRLEGKTTYLKNLIKDITVKDLLYIIQYVLVYDKDNYIIFSYGILYNKEKKFLFSNLINRNITENNKINTIFEYISKIYFNLPQKRSVLREIIKYLYRNLDNLEDIEIYILKSLIK